MAEPGPHQPPPTTHPAAPPWRRLGPGQRRVVQAVLYEVFALAFVGPVLAWGFDQSLGRSLGLGALMSGVALLWNMAFNALFERWEARQAQRHRTFKRRLLHGLGFEGGLAVLLVPLMAYGMQTSLWVAFWADLALMVFFFVYAVGFTWAFDTVFGPPASAIDPAPGA